MTKLVLIRHGQSVWNAENRFTGWVDVDLSDKGVLEAEKSGQIIKDLNINICLLYTSPSPRDKRQSRMPSSA